MQTGRVHRKGRCLGVGELSRSVWGGNSDLSEFTRGIELIVTIIQSGRKDLSTLTEIRLRTKKPSNLAFCCCPFLAQNFNKSDLYRGLVSCVCVRVCILFNLRAWNDTIAWYCQCDNSPSWSSTGMLVNYQGYQALRTLSGMCLIIQSQPLHWSIEGLGDLRWHREKQFMNQAASSWSHRGRSLMPESAGPRQVPLKHQHHNAGRPHTSGCWTPPTSCKHVNVWCAKMVASFAVTIFD